MKGLSKILRNGQNTWALLLAGLLMLYILSRKKMNTSETAQSLDRLIQSTLISNGYSPEMARIVAAVSRHETGNYTSKVFRELNNMFGMRFPRIRKTSALYESDSKYSVYASPADSVLDMVFYLRARQFPVNLDSADDLVKAMKDRGYFEDSYENYVNGVKRALPKVSEI